MPVAIERTLPAAVHAMLVLSPEIAAVPPAQCHCPVIAKPVKPAWKPHFLRVLSYGTLSQKSKKCPITIKKGLSPSRSNATGIVWKPADTVATATYFVRAFVMHNSSSTVSYPVATGASMGFFQVCPAHYCFSPSFCC